MKNLSSWEFWIERWQVFLQDNNQWWIFQSSVKWRTIDIDCLYYQKLVSQLVVHYQGNTFTFYGETAASVFQKYAQSYGLAHKQ